MRIGFAAVVAVALTLSSTATTTAFVVQPSHRRGRATTATKAGASSGGVPSDAFAARRNFRRACDAAETYRQSRRLLRSGDRGEGSLRPLFGGAVVGGGRSSSALSAATEDKIAEAVSTKDATTEEEESSAVAVADADGPVNDVAVPPPPSSAASSPSAAAEPLPSDSTTTATTSPPSLDDEELARLLAAEAELAVSEIVDDTCEITPAGTPVDDLCVDETKLSRARSRLKSVIGRTLRMVRSGDETEEDERLAFAAGDVFGADEGDDGPVPEGELLEKGWEKRGNSSALRRNAEVWKFALKCVFKALKPRKLRKSGASESDVEAAKTDAALFIRDGLLRLGPTFVKLGQVVSTRTDVLPAEYTDVLKTLQDDVPGFSGRRAKEIVTRELGKDCDKVFSDFSSEPLAAASLGQVHTAMYKGKKVAVKVQRAGLKELFDVDLKNLKKLAELLDRFDPKTDGADRDWVSIYEESERLLYLEIDYLNEASNAERFARDFADVEWVRVPEVYRDVSTPRVLTMEFVESFKLTDLDKVDEFGLDRKLLAKRTADAFLRQIVETGYFHCDPHPGNLCADSGGNLVYYDFGMMDELKPNVRSGFRKFCTALFAGGPMISDNDLARNAKNLVDGVEEAGVLARGADRLAVEKLARYFMRSFKNKQLGKESSNVKQTVGTDLQTLTENDVFRFPSTFTFIFRSFASVDGIGKGLDATYDIGKLAQPFVEKFTETQKGYKSETEKRFNILSKATGLNANDISTAVTSPKKIAYIEETLRAMEDGTLKVRVRSLENEKALERMELTRGRMENLMLTSVSLNVVGVAGGPIARTVGAVGAAFFAVQAALANAKVKKFDKTQAKFVSTQFERDEK